MEGLRKEKYKDGSEKEDQRYNKTDIIEKVDAGPEAEILKVYAPSIIRPCAVGLRMDPPCTFFGAIFFA